MTGIELSVFSVTAPHFGTRSTSVDVLLPCWSTVLGTAYDSHCNMFCRFHNGVYSELFSTGLNWIRTMQRSVWERFLTYVSKNDVLTGNRTERLFTALKYTRTCRSPSWKHSIHLPTTWTRLTDHDPRNLLCMMHIRSGHISGMDNVLIKIGLAPVRKTLTETC